MTPPNVRWRRLSDHPTPPPEGAPWEKHHAHAHALDLYHEHHELGPDAEAITYHPRRPRGDATERHDHQERP